MTYLILNSDIKSECTSEVEVKVNDAVILICNNNVYVYWLYVFWLITKCNNLTHIKHVRT